MGMTPNPTELTRRTPWRCARCIYASGKDTLNCARRHSINCPALGLVQRVQDKS